MKPKPPAVYTGTIKDVASFFAVSEMTVGEWVEGRKIERSKEGRNVWFYESSVVKFGVERLAISKRMAPGESEEQVRRDWRAHMDARRNMPEPERLQTIERRLQRLELALAGEVRLGVAA